MMLDATHQYRLPLTTERLFSWHAALFPAGYSGMNKITVGNWRGEEAGPMQVKDPQIGLNHNIGGVGLYGNVTIFGRD